MATGAPPLHTPAGAGGALPWTRPRGSCRRRGRAAVAGQRPVGVFGDGHEVSAASKPEGRPRARPRERSPQGGRRRQCLAGAPRGWHVGSCRRLGRGTAAADAPLLAAGQPPWTRTQGRSPGRGRRTGAAQSPQARRRGSSERQLRGRFAERGRRMAAGRLRDGGRGVAGRPPPTDEAAGRPRGRRLQRRVCVGCATAAETADANYAAAKAAAEPRPNHDHGPGSG